jgi:5-carboxymethyl-2-hydroxymuconate isomerase
MPHLTVEYSANVAVEADIPGLLSLIAGKLTASGVFPVGGVRVRAVRLEDYVIADGQGADDAFVHLTAKIGAGRPEDVKRRVFDELFAAVEAHLAPVFARGPTALSLYVEEADEAGSFKRNTIHQRLKPPAAS